MCSSEQMTLDWKNESWKNYTTEMGDSVLRKETLPCCWEQLSTDVTTRLVP